MFIQKFVNMTKNIPFFPILHVFAPLNDVRAYIALSWKTTLITWFFLRGWYPTSDTSGPPGVTIKQCQRINTINTGWIFRPWHSVSWCCTPIIRWQVTATRTRLPYTHTVKQLSWHLGIAEWVFFSMPTSTDYLTSFVDGTTLEFQDLYLFI